MRHVLTLALAGAALTGIAAPAHADATMRCTGREAVHRPGDWYLCQQPGWYGTCWYFGIMLTPGAPIYYTGC